MNRRTNFSLYDGVRRFCAFLVLLGATGLGVGYVPYAPGTAGSLWGPFLVAYLQQTVTSDSLYYQIVAGFLLFSTFLSWQAVRVLRRTDPPQVVVDEIAAFFVVFAFVQVNWATGILGFLLFRLFDILKPWPIRRLELLPGGFGIMADDLMAGVYAGAILHAVVTVFRYL